FSRGKLYDLVASERENLRRIREERESQSHQGSRLWEKVYYVGGDGEQLSTYYYRRKPPAQALEAQQTTLDTDSI
ncbi:MAG TPA: hypothetical protein VNO32_57530, partial [Candidatus Acidoferrum sp.]|nr:hypothetical protein [Candidatus Acidoferrum sp.]